MSHREHQRAARFARVALLTVSDTRTPADDLAGDTARRLVESAGHRVVDQRIVRDEPDLVRQLVAEWLRETGCDVVITNGGTGISPRDRTIEALVPLFDRPLPGFGELFRKLSFDVVGSAAMLSRAAGGIAAGKPLFALPGSPAAVELALSRLILPELGHLLGELSRES